MSTIQPSRPKTRGECPVARPCPWVTCKYHLYSDYVERAVLIRGPTGPAPRPRVSDRDLEAAATAAIAWLEDRVDDGAPSCALDVADAGALTLEETGALVSGKRVERVTRERIRQLEGAALRKLRNDTPRRQLNTLRDMLETALDRGEVAEPA